MAQMSAPPLRGVTIRHSQSGEVITQGVHEALNVIEYRWSPAGQWLASIGDDGTLQVWPVTYEK
jgi:WD40 repeat protein